jgi:hypothetical protein
VYIKWNSVIDKETWGIIFWQVFCSFLYGNAIYNCGLDMNSSLACQVVAAE